MREFTPQGGDPSKEGEGGSSCEGERVLHHSNVYELAQNVHQTQQKVAQNFSKIAQKNQKRIAIRELEYEVLENVVDERGRPRLSEARAYFLPMEQSALELLTDVYGFWRDYEEYLLLKGENLNNGNVLYLAVKCSKRGNDVFARRLERKLGFLKSVKKVKFFGPKDFKPGRVVQTNLLWVTLTYDSKRCGLHDAWLRCMGEYNLFITNLRNKYGKIDVLRFVQPFDDKKGEAYGFPHFHLVLLFREAQFKVFPRLEENKSGELQLAFRIGEKYELEAQGKWHSFVDVKALSSASGAANYCRKYAQNVCYGESDKALLTSAALWLYRKQTFSMSKGFRENYFEFIMAMHGSKTSMAQKTLEGAIIEDWAWTCFGVRGAGEVGANGEWFLSLDRERFLSLTEVKNYG